MRRSRRGVFPGSFNPPTVAHLAITHSACRHHDLDVVVWAVSEVALAKETVTRPRFEDRLRVLESETAAHDSIEVITTSHQLIADIARGYDVVIMGADKWQQIHDASFYVDSVARDRAVASLPTLAIAPRAGIVVAPEHRLDIDDTMAAVSSTRARQGARDTMSAAARRFDRETGAWTDPARYERWVSDQISR